MDKLSTITGNSCKQPFQLLLWNKWGLKWKSPCEGSCSIEADVNRMKHAMGRSDKSPLSFLAAAIEEETTIHGFLTEYLSKASFLIARGREVTESVQSLQNMESKPAAVVPLLNMMKNVPALQQGLRAQCTVELLRLLRLKLGSVWESVKASEHKDSHVLSNTSALIAEGILLYPFDTDLQSYSQDVGNLMREQTEGKMVETILEATGKIRGTDIEDVKSFKEAIDDFMTQVKDVGGTGNLTQEQESSFLLTEHTFFNFIRKHYTKIHDHLALFESIAQAGQKIASLVGAKQISDVMQAFTEAITMEKLKSAHDSLGGPPVADPEDKYLSSCLGLLRQKMKIESIMKELSGNEFQLKDQFDHSMQSVNSLIDKVKKQWTKMVKQKVSEKWESLKKVAGGKETGHWLDGYQGANCWDTLLQHAKKVLLVGNPVALQTLHTETHEAMRRGPPMNKRSEAGDISKKTLTQITF
eukprot:6492647-Amphidinium_carterae.3